MLSIALFLACLTLITAKSGVSFPLRFTGRVDKDFAIGDNNEGRIKKISDGLDVGAPPGWPFPYSGWDVKRLYFAYDFSLDLLHIGIECFGICGDADGDGFPGKTSAPLESRGGSDLPNFDSSETCAIALDIGDPSTRSGVPDGTFDFVVGYPAEMTATNEVLPTGCTDLGTDCFGLYRYDNTPGVQQVGQRFLFDHTRASDQQLLQLARDHNTAASSTQPHLEWTIDMAQLRTFNMQLANRAAFSIEAKLFCGSFQDDGLGEDAVPNAGNSIAVLFVNNGNNDGNNDDDNDDNNNDDNNNDNNDDNDDDNDDDLDENEFIGSAIVTRMRDLAQAREKLSEAKAKGSKRDKIKRLKAKKNAAKAALATAEAALLTEAAVEPVLARLGEARCQQERAEAMIECHRTCVVGAATAVEAALCFEARCAFVTFRATVDGKRVDCGE